MSEEETKTPGEEADQAPADVEGVPSGDESSDDTDTAQPEAPAEGGESSDEAEQA